jgi:hypothetical protein
VARAALDGTIQHEEKAMANATGFLLRTNLSDTGTLPRTGSWTGCPDIIAAGTTAKSRQDLVTSYGSVTDKPLTQGLTNYLYVRAKNMNATPLSQVAYLFQVPGSLVLHPEIWYKATNLVGYDVKNPGGGGTPDDPKIAQKYAQTLSAQPAEIVVSDAYNWKPESTEHHCLVAVVADTWQDVVANYRQAGSMDALAQWIYGNPSMGWHNVNIQPITSTIYESQIPYAHSNADEAITFTIVAENVPVGAQLSFSANTSTASDQTIGQDWTPVSAPAGGGNVNPDFEVGTTIQVNAGYATIITYRTDFRGLTPPANFKMHMKATKTTTATTAQVQASPAANLMATDSLEASFHRSHSANALFRDAEGADFGQGVDGYRAMLAASPYDDSDDDGDLEDSVVVVVGSHTTTPVSS